MDIKSLGAAAIFTILVILVVKGAGKKVGGGLGTLAGKI
jgi:hypothetical protein